jgi:uncharacterized membrane protein
MPRAAKVESNSSAPQHDRPVRTRRDPAALARLLDEWMHEDETEQRETFEFLRRALDEGRPIGYKLFS